MSVASRCAKNYLEYLEAIITPLTFNADEVDEDEAQSAVGDT
jgi:hypothetical protein